MPDWSTAGPGDVVPGGEQADPVADDAGRDRPPALGPVVVLFERALRELQLGRDEGVEVEDVVRLGPGLGCAVVGDVVRRVPGGGHLAHERPGRRRVGWPPSGGTGRRSIRT